MISNDLPPFVPADLPDAALVGRIWRNAPIDGPSVVVVRAGQVYDITASAPTTSDLFERLDLLELRVTSRARRSVPSRTSARHCSRHAIFRLSRHVA